MSQRIITEADIKKLKPHQEVVLDWNTIITPSALDAAYTLGVRIIDQRPEKRRHSAKNNERDLEKTTQQLADGDYVLQIRNGRMRIFEISEKGVKPVQGF